MNRWFVLLGCFIGMSVATPAILMIPMGLFLKSVTVEFGWSRTEFSVILSAASICNALIMPVAGYLVDRFGGRRVAFVGTVLGCGSYAALSLADSYVAFVAIMSFSVTMGNLASYPAFMGLTQRWFDKRLGLALAITSTGLAVGVGGFSYLIAQTIAANGWRQAFLTIGVIAMMIGLANLLFFVRDNHGPLPEAERRGEILNLDQHGLTLRDALLTRDLWLYATGFGLVILAVVGCNFHLPAMLSDQGGSPAVIATIVAAGSIGSLFGRLTSGFMLDRISVRKVAGLFFAGQAIGLLLLLDGLQWAVPAGFLLGAVQGAEIDLLGYVVARRFGRRAYAQIFGMCFSLTLLGAIIGPIGMGMIYDHFGSYDVGLMLFPLLPILAFVLISFARITPQETDAQPMPDVGNRVQGT